ncbi:M15 family metallopeptidase [Clostridiaceae bacterium 35-E11]
MKQDLLCLMRAYPEDITGIKREVDRVYVVMKSGKTILYDDKEEKSIEEKVNNPDLQDMMEQIYPLREIHRLMEKDFDPGRVRVYPLLKEVYGKHQKEVESNLVNVRVGYKQYPFNRNNKAAEALQRAMEELGLLLEQQKDIYPFLYPASGTFNYRIIAGTNRLSPHAFGTAIDLARDKRDYWKWASREAGEKRLQSYPKEIVEVFEKYHFIWGGKWGHFDILHFEYRPELILKAQYFGDKFVFQKAWYEGVPLEDPLIKKYIEMIDRVL